MITDCRQPKEIRGANAGRRRGTGKGLSPLVRWALFCGLFVVGASSASAATPSNAELYRMLLELKGDVTRLRQEAQQARAEADAAKAELAATRQELSTARAGPAPAGRASTATPWTAGVDVLYVRPSTKLDYAILDPTPGNREPDVGSKTLEVDPDYSAGYRLNLGYTLPNALDVTARYTSLNTDDSDSAEKGTGEIHPIALHVGPGNEDADSATAKYDIDYWTTDVELGKSVFGTGNTGVRLFGGLRYASIDQSLDAQYFGNRNPPVALDDIPAGLPSSLSVESDFSGVGARLGATGEWEFARGFSLFGGVGGSMLVGDLKTTYVDTQYNNYFNRWDYRSLEDKDENHVVTAIETEVGLSWRYVTGTAVLELAVGYQFEQWFNVLGTVQFPAGGVINAASDPNPDGHMVKSYEDLSLQGPFVRVQGRF